MTFTQSDDYLAGKTTNRTEDMDAEINRQDWSMWVSSAPRSRRFANGRPAKFRKIIEIIPRGKHIG